MVLPAGSKSFDSQGFLITAQPTCARVSSTVVSLVVTTGLPASNIAQGMQEDSKAGSATLAQPTASPLASVSVATLQSAVPRNGHKVVYALVALVASSFLCFALV